MKPKTIKFILVFFNLVMLSSLGWSQCDGCNYQFSYSYVWYPDIWLPDSEINNENILTCENSIVDFSDCNENDVQFLKDLIEQNNINEQSSIFDYDDGDGLFETNELGKQIWSNGRLVGFGIYDNGTNLDEEEYFDYNVTVIPQSISNLEHIIYLDLDNNSIETLPSTFNSLQTLEYLWLGNSRTNDVNHMSQIPESIWELVNLKLLGIQGTDISEISDDIGNLTNLTDLFLNMNNLTMISPIILNMTSLTSLWIDDNKILGEIPVEISNLINLTYLDLGGNELNSQIPLEIGNLTHLVWLSLSGNQLSGEIPSEIGNLTNLISLSLGINQLSGEIPPEIGNLTNLISLLLNDNQFTTIPESIGELSDMKYFSLLKNNILNIPESIGNLNSLESLLLNDNQLITLPESIGNLSSLERLHLSNNQLTTLTEDICNLTNLNWSTEYVDYSYSYIYNNHLCPPYPECIEDSVGEQDLSDCVGFTEIDGNYYYQSDLDVLQDIIDVNESLSGEEPIEIGSQLWVDGKLDSLDLDHNQLTTLPESIGNLSSLEYLDLYYNQLTTLPESIGNLSSLLGLWLGRNQLTTLPESIGNLSSLELLWVEFNQLTTLIESIGNLSSLKNLYLSSNQFTTLPESIGNLSSLEWLSLSDNQLTTLPESIGNLSSLLGLILFDNQLTTLPESIGNLSSLLGLDLKNNQLITLPESICDLPEGNILVSGNKLCEQYHYDCIDDWEEQDCELSIIDNLIPTVYNLSSPYPNPFNPTTTISFSIPQSGVVSLNVYDITGKLVTTLINEQLNIGYHSIDWDGTNQSSAMNLLRLESGDYIETQKLLLVK